MAVIIRRAGPGDAPAVVRLVGEMAAGEGDASPVDEDSVRHFLASPVSGALLAFDDDDPIGLLSFATVPGLFHAGDSGLIETLIVTGSRRGEGIGPALVRAALALFEEAGCAEASVSTEADNEVAQRIYCDAGLTEASVLLEKHFTR